VVESSKVSVRPTKEGALRIVSGLKVLCACFRGIRDSSNSANGSGLSTEGSVCRPRRVRLPKTRRSGSRHKQAALLHALPFSVWGPVLHRGAPLHAVRAAATRASLRIASQQLAACLRR
jgi:hypothetical protein